MYERCIYYVCFRNNVQISNCSTGSSTMFASILTALVTQHGTRRSKYIAYKYLSGNIFFKFVLFNLSGTRLVDLISFTILFCISSQPRSKELACRARVQRFKDVEFPSKEALVMEETCVKVTKKWHNQTSYRNLLGMII